MRRLEESAGDLWECAYFCVVFLLSPFSFLFSFSFLLYCSKENQQKEKKNKKKGRSLEDCLDVNLERANVGIYSEAR